MPGALPRGPATGLFCYCMVLAMWLLATGEFYTCQELYLQSSGKRQLHNRGARAWLGKAGTGIRPQLKLVPTACFVSSQLTAGTFLVPRSPDVEWEGGRCGKGRPYQATFAQDWPYTFLPCGSFPLYHMWAFGSLIHWAVAQITPNKLPKDLPNLGTLAKPASRCRSS